MSWSLRPHNEAYTSLLAGYALQGWDGDWGNLSKQSGFAALPAPFYVSVIFNNGWRLHAAKRHSKTGCALLASRYSFLLSELRDKIAELSESNRQQLILNSDNQEAYFEQKTIHSTLRSHLSELDVELVVHQGVRLEKGK
ncbi:hypothetical protein [Hafnia alvei]|uniref:hypothetical protein n=1 Tax=Hafnia alvei TaxID=569 RepID=UPI0024A8ECC6|nr:hypothetical protein [Hafnia alvei]